MYPSQSIEFTKTDCLPQNMSQKLSLFENSDSSSEFKKNIPMQNYSGNEFFIKLH